MVSELIMLSNKPINQLKVELTFSSVLFSGKHCIATTSKQLPVELYANNPLLRAMGW